MCSIRDFDGQCGICGEPSQRRTSAKWCAIIRSVWSFVIACGVECMMSKEHCPPAAIIIVFINCIVDGGRTSGCMWQKYLTFGFARTCRIVKNVWWEIYLINSFLFYCSTSPRACAACRLIDFYNTVISWTDISRMLCLTDCVSKQEADSEIRTSSRRGRLIGRHAYSSVSHQSVRRTIWDVGRAPCDGFYTTNKRDGGFLIQQVHSHKVIPDSRGLRLIFCYYCEVNVDWQQGLFLTSTTACGVLK